MEEKIINNSEEISEKDKKIEQLENQIQMLKEQFNSKFDQEKNNFLLKAAEFDNSRKRLQKESEEIIKYANEKLIIKFLDILDNLDRTVYFAQTTKNFDVLLKGIEMTLSQFKETLEKENVRAIEAIGKQFDPNLHHAIAQEENDNHEENSVIEEMRKGYTMTNKVIRPTLVKVSKKGKDVNKNG